MINVYATVWTVQKVYSFIKETRFTDIEEHDGIMYCAKKIKAKYLLHSANIYSIPRSKELYPRTTRINKTQSLSLRCSHSTSQMVFICIQYFCSLDITLHVVPHNNPVK